MSVLFKIIKNQKISFLYGTIHLSDESVCKLSPEAKNAFEQSNCVLVEMPGDQTSELLRCINLKTEEWKNRNPISQEASYADYLTASQIKKIGELFQLNTSTALFQQVEIPPMILCNYISTKYLQNLGLLGYVLDKQLAQHAEAIRKPVIGLDSLEDVSERLLGFTFDYESQINYAKYYLSNHLMDSVKLKNSTEMLKEAYLTGNYQEIKEIAISHDNKISCEYWKNIVEGRDVVFVEKMQPYLNNGEAFVAIGSAHLSGVISLLKQQGYAIIPIEESERSYEISALENTNISLLKKNLLKDINCHHKITRSFFSGIPRQDIYLLHDKFFLIFLDLLKEEKIDKNIKIQIEIKPSYGEEDWMNINSILQESNVPNFIELHWDEFATIEDMERVVGLFKSNIKLEELCISCLISDNGVRYLIDSLKETEFAAKLSVLMDWKGTCNLHKELWDLLEAGNAQCGVAPINGRQ